MSVSERRKKVEGYDAVIIGSAGKFQLHIFIVAWEDTIYQEILFQTNASLKSFKNVMNWIAKSILL